MPQGGSGERVLAFARHFFLFFWFLNQAGMGKYAEDAMGQYGTHRVFV